MAFGLSSGAVSLIGGGLGLLAGGSDGGGQQTATKEPWEPARKPLINSLETGQNLERYYQQNPFNQLQRTGYQNLYSDLDQFRNQTAPGLMQFANRLMNSNYQRGNPQPSMGQPMMMQQGGDGVYSTKPMQTQGGQGGGLMAAMGQAGGMSQIDPNQSMAGAMQGGNMAYQGSAPQGLLASIQPGPFSAPTQGSYGLLDFMQLNPFTATNGIPATPVADKPAEKTPEQIAEEERRRRQQSGEGFRGEGA